MSVENEYPVNLWHGISIINILMLLGLSGFGLALTFHFFSSLQKRQCFTDMQKAAESP